jgi:diguanylate cyclase (GGDEF)-like protein/PAS domain S-box-containing protein
LMKAPKQKQNNSKKPQDSGEGWDTPTDISEHEELEQLRRVEEDLRLSDAILKQMPDAILLVDLDGNVRRWDGRAEQIFGYTAEEMIGQPVSIINHPDIRANMTQRIVQEIQTSGQFFGEVACIRKDGSEVPVELTSKAVCDVDGRPIAFIGVNRDISERKRAEQALRTSDATMRAMINAAVDSMFLVDTDMQILALNVTAAERLGRRAEEMLGGNLLDFFPSAVAETRKVYVQQALHTGKAVQFEDERLGRQMDNTIYPVFDDSGKVTRLAWYGRDITELRQSEIETMLANEKLKVWVSELEQRNRESDLLRQIGDLLQVCSSFDESFAVIQQFGPMLFPGTCGGLYVHGESHQSLEAAAVWGQKIYSESTFLVEDCWALRRGQIHMVNSSGAGLRCRHVAPEIPGDYLGIPMTSAGEALGLLHLEFQQDRPSDQAVQDLAQTVAEHLTLSLANLKLRETLRSQSIRDALTGLYNRRYMEESLERELHRAARKGWPVCVIMLDIDHFKSYNDRFGHEAGDEMLRKMGTLLQSNIRREDIACRYGGEEFLLILPDAGLEVGRQRAERIREVVGTVSIEFRHTHLDPVTLSLGVAAYPQHGLDQRTVLHAADMALYQAKHNGRNRVEVVGFE